jgi:hypothetical protein
VLCSVRLQSHAEPREPRPPAQRSMDVSTHVFYTPAAAILDKCFVRRVLAVSARVSKVQNIHTM